MIKKLDEIIPKDWFMVNSSGHCSYYAAHMFGRSANNFLTIREFGAIGNGLSYAVGAAVARPNQQIVLIDGDGGFLMHAQELETVQRMELNYYGVLNDRAFGSKFISSGLTIMMKMVRLWKDRYCLYCSRFWS